MAKTFGVFILVELMSEIVKNLRFFSYNAMNCALIEPKSVKGIKCSKARGGMLSHSSAACEGRETLEAQNDVKPNALQRKIK